MLLLDQPFADPCLSQRHQSLFAYATGHDQVHVQLAVSVGGEHWTTLGDALPRPPRWTPPDLQPYQVWAPHLVTPQASLNGHYELLFAAPHRDHGRYALGHAFAPTPHGPFLAFSEPLVDQPDAGGVIDPFVYHGHVPLLLYKTDGNHIGQPCHIMLRPYHDAAAAPVALLTNDLPWEGDCIEAPTLFRLNGEWVLLYSANCYHQRDYAIGMATSRHLLGPYTKRPTPILSTAHGQGIGPGGQDVIAIDGRLWLYYHAWTPGMPHRALHRLPLMDLIS